jgi:DNA-binding transcriptional MocR family regulator
MSTLYFDIARRIAEGIEKGAYLAGDRLPGVRRASAAEGVSPSTIVAAYRQLETDGYIEARPRSGYYVRRRASREREGPSASRPPRRPCLVQGQERVLQLLNSVGRQDVAQLGASVPDSSFLATGTVSRAIATASREHRSAVADCELPPGLPALRRQIARHMSNRGCPVDPAEVVVTSGCQEALYLSLKAVTSPGDIVAIESPAYYGLLQALDALGLQALEIPTDPALGMSVDALQLALEQWPVRACVLVPNFSNPTGALMPPERRRALMALADAHRDLVLIEDDIYGDLYFEGPRPGALKAMETRDNVLYCASFSKTLSPGLRIGWVVGGGRTPVLAYQKFVTNCATATVAQYATAEILARGGYDRHLRTLRLELARAVGRMSERVCQVLPPEVRVTRPAGGLCLWLEFPPAVDTADLADAALARNISVAHGALFTPSPDKFGNCLRLNCAVRWSPAVERALAFIAEYGRARTAAPPPTGA